MSAAGIEARLELERGTFRLDVELTAPAAGVTVVFGPTGAGKTLLLRAVAGLEPEARGELTVGGEVWQDRSRFLAPHRRPLGFVFQEPSLFAHLSVRQNLEYGWRRARPSGRSLDFERVVALLGVEPLLARRPAGLSGGERQRVAIARALLPGPRVLLMDEPLSALDLASRREILPFLERLVGQLEIPVLYVTHAADELARLADQLVLLERGRARAAGPLGELLARTDLPLARGEEAASVVMATVAGEDPGDGLATLSSAAGPFMLPARGLEPGAPVRLRILARDVSLTLERQRGTSILNIFPATVAELELEGEGRVVVRLDAGGESILSHVTHRSARALALAPGKAVWAQIKTVALLR